VKKPIAVAYANWYFCMRPKDLWFYPKEPLGETILLGKNLTFYAVPLMALASVASASELFVNGGFETGDLTGWTASTQAGSGGSLFVQSGTNGPTSGLPTVGPDSGSFYALTDQSGPGAYSLTQSFTVDPSSSVILSFDLFANNYYGTTIVGPLDYTAGPVQFATVDLLTGTANPFSTAPSDVLENFYSGSDAGANPNPYTAYSFDITSLVGAGGTFQIRFGVADRQNYFNLGIDNVSAQETPEPAAFFLLGPALVGMIALRRKISRA
jgi:hypothetical protein